MAVNYPNYYPYQARPAYMEPQMQMQQVQFLGLKGRPVASIDEAKASIIDFDGSVFYFPDSANKRIYTKQINIDGTSSLNVYVKEENAVPAQEVPMTGVTREEFDKTIAALMQEIELLKAQPKGSAEPTAAYNF